MVTTLNTRESIETAMRAGHVWSMACRAVNTTVLTTTAHVQLNVGWERLTAELRVALGLERPELVVGFLPVT